MGQTLTHGIYLPDEGERNCYNGLAANWSILDGAVGTIAEHTSALASKAPLVHTHTKADITDFPAYGTTAGTICEGNDSRLSDARTPVAHTHTKSDVTDLLNSNFIPSADTTYNLGSATYRWGSMWGSSFRCKSANLDLADSVTTGNKENWYFVSYDKNENILFSFSSQRNHSLGINSEHFRIKNASGKWADLYIQLDDDNQFTIGTSAHSDVTNIGFRGKFTPFGSFIPYVNNSYDLGSSSYQWNNLYAKNYYYNGVAWGLDKANVWTNEQTYSTYGYGQMLRLQNTGLDFSVNGNTGLTETYQHLIHWVDKNNTSYSMVQSWTNSSENVLVLRSYYRTDANTRRDSSIRNQCTATAKRWYPETDADTDLGITGHRWKTLNGINPGALSLPGDYTSSVTEYISDKTGENNTYTAPADGWVGIQASSATLDSGNFVFMGRTSDGSNYYAQNASSPINGYWSNLYHGCIILPVIGGKTYGIRCKCDSVDAKFYKANGNVS